MRSRVADYIQNESPYRKTKIPKALREQVWLNTIGEHFQNKCKVVWCKNRMNVFDFQCGHNIPESKGGQTTLDNLVPICSRCNISMGNRYSIDEWNAKFRSSRLDWLHRLFRKRE
jgi:5-methylcytosine-specific restriction endonuclease McrA